MVRYVLLCALLIAALAPGDVYPVSQEPGVNRLGMDYTNFETDSHFGVEMCARRCLVDSRCEAYTYVKPGFQGPAPRCWLKSGVPQAVADDCCVSGTKGPPVEGSALAVVYEHNDYAGRSQVLDVGRYDIGQLDIGNDVISSVKVPPGWKVTLNQHAGFQGATKVITADTLGLPDFNDQTSSIVVEASALTSLSGDTSCVWGSANCNRCVPSVSGELDRLQNDYHSAARIRFDGYAYRTPGYILHRISSGSYEHVQSVGRIAGVGDNEYMVFTHSTASGESWKEGALAVVRMGARQDTGGGAFYGMPNGDGSNQNTSNRTVARTYAGNNHPGGLSVLGHYVYVAQWCQDHGEYRWCKESSATVHPLGFSVYDVSEANLNSSINSNPPMHSNYRHVYGESWIGSSSTATVAAVKLSSGQYLVALGRSGGREYGFYTATSSTGPFTFHNSSSIGYWGENANIVTECDTGDLYMFQIEGYGSSDDVDKVHLYKLLLNNGLIGFQYVKSRTFYCRGNSVDGASDWCHFDAGAGMYVTPEGHLILYATDWQQSSYGNIRLVEFH